MSQQWPGAAPAGQPQQQKPSGGAGKAIVIGLVVAVVCAVPVIGILAAIAIPNFIKYQHRAKESEARANLAAIAAMENAHFAEHGRYLTAPPTPRQVPRGDSAQQVSFDGPWKELGFEPFGKVRYQYEVRASGTGERAVATVIARGDVDGDGQNAELRQELRGGRREGDVVTTPGEH